MAIINVAKIRFCKETLYIYYQINFLNFYWMRHGYHLSMTNKTVYNLSFNSHCRILAAEPNYIFTNIFIQESAGTSVSVYCVV